MRSENRRGPVDAARPGTLPQLKVVILHHAQRLDQVIESVADG